MELQEIQDLVNVIKSIPARMSSVLTQLSDALDAGVPKSEAMKIAHDGITKVAEEITQLFGGEEVMPEHVRMAYLALKSNLDSLEAAIEQEKQFENKQKHD